MAKEWSERTADEKREERFKRWLSPENVNFISLEAEQQYKVRVQRFIDAISLKEPDRVPVLKGGGAARYSGYTIREIMYDADKLIKAAFKYMDDFDHDACPTVMVRCGKALDILDSKMLKWAGHGLPDDCEFQYVEGEYLKAGEWEDMMNDPSDFQIRTYLPRIYGAAGPLRKLPPLSSFDDFGTGLLSFADPEILNAFKTLGEAGKADAEWFHKISVVTRRGRERGFPPFYGGIGRGAPLDGIGAGLRGTEGTIMDMYRQPERLLEYMEKMVPITIERAAGGADMTGVPIIMIPMHRGADGFMSEEQFHTFYWPFLKRVILGYVEHGLVPVMFVEGGFNSRLETIKDLPKGKVVWYFDKTDMARAKEILGDTCCLMGNVSTSLMCTGTPGEVKAYCRKLIEAVGPGGGYILAPGAFAEQAKIENSNAMLEAAKEYGVYRK